MSRRPVWARRTRALVLPLACVAGVGGCEYVRLLRPSVLKQLNPRVVRLVNELPATDNVNEALIGRLFAHGGAADARVGGDGVMRIRVNVPPDKYLWEPAVIIMPRGGTLEMEFTNPDRVLHAAFLPSNGGREMLWIPEGKGGRARLTLDQPGYYFFGCPIQNHAGRGMLGLILVKGDTPEEARLDRPPALPITERSTPFASLNEGMRGSAPPVADAVTPERLANARAEPQNWLTYYGTYDGQRYSALDQISTGTVAQLRPAWVFNYQLLGLHAAPVTSAFEAAPIVVDGVMYVTGPGGYLWALDAATGEKLWEYQHQIPIDVALCCGNVNRGAAVARGKVYMATANGYLVALDARTGKRVWQTAFADVRAGESATLAPLVVKNLVLVGNSGAEYGVRGHIDAIDAESGRRVWRTYTVPRPGEPGSETWPAEPPNSKHGGAWARGGGTAWITGTYDPELDLVYWGTGNPSPVFDGTGRQGTNLYTSAVVALDPDDGRIRWHYQWTPHDVWDYDGVGESILFDQGGRRLLGHFDRNGYLFILDRTNGAFVRASRFARADWGDIDSTTGRVTPRRLPSEQGTRICPGPAGAKVWNHGAYSRQTGLLYVPVIELCATFKSEPEEFKEGLPYLGSGFQNTDEEDWGHVKAFDPATGREVWSWRGEAPMVTSLLATAGGLVFSGEPSGMFNAHDARTGQVLWRFQTGSGIHSNPVTYSVRGKQYVAVPVGWGGWLEGFAPKNYGVQRAISLQVFALP